MRDLVFHGCLGRSGLGRSGIREDFCHELLWDACTFGSREDDVQVTVRRAGVANAVTDVSSASCLKNVVRDFSVSDAEELFC
jgi:hypothetical protein